VIIQKVKFKSGLSEEELWKVVDERAPYFRQLDGLLQKYYVRDPQTGEVAGVYIWDSMDSLQQFRQSELAKTIPEAYKVEGQPQVETLEVVKVLRAEKAPAAS
jgi:heme-degrading monooxygenase HmoA